MRLRSAVDGDLPLFQRIERAAGEMYRAIGMEEIADDEPPTLEVLSEYRRVGHAWVAVDDGDLPVAYLIAERMDDALHIEQVTVHPDYTRRRIGRSLLDHAATVAEEEALEALTLTTFKDVPWNAPYYAACGFAMVADGDLTPGLRAIREREAAHGLERWPRVCMRRHL
ncbi:GNAT family N-acetyltransferase [Salininema proteolyticum]|uniref:GNAT family N-acetyltransferase n=1 Tax=Salininema proteolyticum TaxID=1607685 RepID=A0ABV8TXC9_9ACTN